MRVSPRPQLAAQWRRTAAAPPIVRSSVANALIRYPKYKISRRYTPCTASSSFSAPYCADVKPVRPNKRGNDIVAHFEPDTMTNLTDVILRRVGKDLHRAEHHPLARMKRRVHAAFPGFALHDDFSPFVSTHANFDSLLVPADHESRSKSDTYYCNAQNVLRTHTSAHQTELIGAGAKKFLVAGDVYRRDEIDVTHFPVFHQLEGVRIFDESELPCVDDGTAASVQQRVAVVERDMKTSLEQMVDSVFGADLEKRWVDAYFPFTHPSFELEILFNGDWLEVLGCGVIHEDILRAALPSSSGGSPRGRGWAFGIGLERLAMVLYNINDIRLFWTDDERFHVQFEGITDEQRISFEPYSKYPACYKDIAFWMPERLSPGEDAFHENDLNEMIRDVAGDLVESVERVDTFIHPKTKRESRCYRINFRHMDRNLTNEEVNLLQEAIRRRVAADFGAELR